MMNQIVVLHSPPMRKDAAENNETLLRSTVCQISYNKRSFYTDYESVLEKVS